MAWRTSTNKAPNAREERFSKTVETGRWWRGAPESIKTMVVEYKGTLLLGIAKMNRRSQGHTATGIRKPQRYQQSTRTLFYNLGDVEHVCALLHTVRHLTAYAAGLKQNLVDKRYCLNIGQRRVLSRARLQLNNEYVDSLLFDGHEVLEVQCENANYRNPHNRVNALDPEIRQRARDRWRAQCTPLPRITFKLRRTLNTSEEELRGFAINDASELEIPLEAVEKVADALRVTIQYVWSYVNRNPSQTLRCLDDRWQLHKLDPVDRVLMPRMAESLSFTPEPALFFNRELYDARIPRTLLGSAELHPLYLRRLEAYDAGELRWNYSWITSEWEAQDDVARLRKQAYAQMAARMRLMLFLLVLALTIKKARRHGKRGVRLHSEHQEPRHGPREGIELRSRGPPRHPP